jgi:hypothetical protein
MIDKTFDNDDNPYLKFKYSMDTKLQLEDSNDHQNGNEHIDIPMVKCDMKDLMSNYIKDKYYEGQFYCPDFDETHFLFSNIFQENYSYFKLQVEYCN